jgi:general secretion pathway protein F
VPVIETELATDKQTQAQKVSETNNHAKSANVQYQTDTVTRTSAKDISIFARHLATLLRAGMPLVPALSALAEQSQEDSGNKAVIFKTESNSFAKIIEQIRNSVSTGSTLADALRQHPNTFSTLFVNMVAVAEASGNMEDILLRLAEMLEKRVSLIGKVKAAIAYPLMMIVVAAGVVIFLLSFVVPSITQIFLEINRGLPWPTRLLISTSAFIKTYFILITITICGTLFGIGMIYRTTQGRLFIDRFKLKLPLFGKLFLKFETARLTRTLGVLLASGIPILNAVEISKKVIQNHFIAKGLEPVKDLVSKGETLANSIKKTGLFPPIVFHIIATGQAGGNLEDGLIDIANMYDEEVDRLAKTLTSLLEPAILLVMGIVIGFIVMAILLPIFEINQAI